MFSFFNNTQIHFKNIAKKEQKRGSRFQLAKPSVSSSSISIYLTLSGNAGCSSSFFA
jgi:hypothetical protein